MKYIESIFAAFLNDNNNHHGRLQNAFCFMEVDHLDSHGNLLNLDLTHQGQTGGIVTY